MSQRAVGTTDQSHNALEDKESELMRETLKKARTEKQMTQQQVADHLGISLVYYQKIEQGSRTGEFEIWDSLEDLFNIHQRKLREIL